MLPGTVSPTQADIIIATVNDLPPGAWVRRRGEKVLVGQAAHLNASELAKVGRRVAEVVDPDAVDRKLEAALEREERAAHLDRYLAISQDRAGGVRIRGRGSAEDGALLKAALLPLTCPDPITDPETGENYADPRDHGARLWDALVTTAQHALDTHLPPDTHGAPARLLVTIDHQTLKHDLDATGVGTTADGTDLKRVLPNLDTPHFDGHWSADGKTIAVPARLDPHSPALNLTVDKPEQDPVQLDSVLDFGQQSDTLTVTVGAALVTTALTAFPALVNVPSSSVRSTVIA